MTNNQAMASISAALVIGFGTGGVVRGSIERNELRSAIVAIAPEQNSDVLASLPEHQGLWLGCERADAEIDQGDGRAPLASHMRCDWSVDGRVEPQWLTPEQEAVARSKVSLP